VALNVSGGTPPYSFSVAAVDLYAGTSTLPIGDVYNQAYVPGEAIGRIRIVATDENGEEVNLYFNVVPIAPTLVLKNQAPDVRIEWNYTDTVAVNSIRIDRSVNSSLFDLRHTSISMEDHFLDTGVLVGGIASLSYRCYSVAGTYVSIPAEGSLLP
jgi:hypothetical protein